MEEDKIRIILNALRDHGYNEHRDTTHGTLFVGPEGQRFLLSHPNDTDRRAWLNARAELRRLGIWIR